jgi:hypothetical protein
MKYLRIVFLFSLALMISTGCEKEQVEPDSLNTNDSVLKGAKAKKDKDHFVPFKGTFDVSVDLSSVVILPPKYQFAYAEGNATHLGKTKVVLEQWWRPTSDQTVFPWYGGGWGLITFTAANGDILKASYMGAVATHNESDPVLVSLTATITDGTGRFEDAEGSFDWDVEYYQPPQNTGTVTLKGIIKY